MNTDHAASLKDYALVYGSVDWADSVSMCELTIDGFSLRCQSRNGREELVCVNFPKMVRRQEQVRGLLVAMAKQARATISRKE